MKRPGCARLSWQVRSPGRRGSDLQRRELDPLAADRPRLIFCSQMQDPLARIPDRAPLKTAGIAAASARLGPQLVSGSQAPEHRRSGSGRYPVTRSERWQSGRMRRSRNRYGSLGSSRVQIPPSPLEHVASRAARRFAAAGVQAKSTGLELGGVVSGRSASSEASTTASSGATASRCECCGQIIGLELPPQFLQGLFVEGLLERRCRRARVRA